MASSYATHQLDIYRVTLHVATTRKGWGALRRKYPKQLPAIDDDAGGLAAYMGHTLCFYIGPSDDPADRVDIIAHEASHGAGAILEHRGIPSIQHEDGYYPTGSEALAYLTGWLTRWLWSNT